MEKELMLRFANNATMSLNTLPISKTKVNTASVNPRLVKSERSRWRCMIFKQVQTCSYLTGNAGQHKSKKDSHLIRTVASGFMIGSLRA